MHWVYLGIAIVAEVFATSALKAADGFRNWPPLLLSYAGYATAFVFLALTLKTMNVGIAYAIWSGVGTALIVAVAWMIYGQKLDAGAIVGLSLILAGAVVLNLFSKTVAR